MLEEIFPDDANYVLQGKQEIDRWPLISNTWIAVTITLLYLIFVIEIGPKFMKNRKPFNLKPMILLYNFYQIYINAYWILGCVSAPGVSAYVWRHGCHPVDPVKNPLIIHFIKFGWLFFITRVVDFVDTVFFVLRKKQDQVTFLHVFHHSETAMLTFYFIKYTLGEQLYVFGLCNCCVHIIMYTYYFVAALGPRFRKYLWWKSYLTIIQLVQFVIVGAHSLALIIADCSVPRHVSWLIFGQACLLFVLFFDFYRKTYITKKDIKMQITSDEAHGGSSENIEIKIRASNEVRSRKSQLSDKKNLKTEENENAKFSLESEKTKSQEVLEFYGKIANYYDRFTDFSTFGFNRIWKQSVVNRLSPSHGTHLLDVAGGTGEIAFRYLKYLKDQPNPDKLTSCVTVCDISEAMLNVGKKRAKRLGYTNENQVQWILGDGENLPIESESVSAYTISFGMRHMAHIDKALLEAYRVLKPGGQFICLEFSQANNKLLKNLIDWYSLTLIPYMRQILSGQWRRHQHLAENQIKFPAQEVFKSMIEEAGFQSVTYDNLLFGISAIHTAIKP